MKTFFRYFLTGVKYLLLQATLEVVLVVVLEYLGVNVLADFSNSNLFVENIEGVLWAISMKTIFLSVLYLPIFVLLCYLIVRKTLITKLITSIVNLLLNLMLLITFLLLKNLEFVEILSVITFTLIASLIIIAIIGRPRCN